MAEELLSNGRESVQGVLDRALNRWISRESDHETIRELLTGKFSSGMDSPQARHGFILVLVKDEWVFTRFG